jgi:hypothetical protein
MPVFVVLFLVPTATLAQNTTGDDLLERGQGLIFDSEDDLANIPRTPEYRAFLPDRVDLSDRFPTPGDQGRQNSCVGWSVGYAARAYYANKAEGRDLSVSKNIPSPAYIYNSIKKVSGPDQCGYGSKISDALNLLGRGAASLREVPYSEDSCLRPSDSVRAHATDFRIANAYVVDPKNVDQIKAQLAHGHPVIIGLQTTLDFHRLKRGEIYRSTGRLLGNHAITAVGYDERLQALKVINSWGREWGDGGFGWIDYDALRREARQAFVTNSGDQGIDQRRKLVQRRYRDPSLALLELDRLLTGANKEHKRPIPGHAPPRHHAVLRFHNGFHAVFLDRCADGPFVIRVGVWSPLYAVRTDANL